MKTKLRVGFGAAVAADSAFCLMNFLRKGDAVGLTAQDIQEAPDVGDQVKNKAQITNKVWHLTKILLC